MLSAPQLGSLEIPMQHRGVSIDDQRNAGVIAYFKPEEISRDALIKGLKEVAPVNKSPRGTAE
jgi:hypothetical protein